MPMTLERVGASGRWPNEQAVQSFLSHQAGATVAQIARHEAGHAVLAHAIGVPCERVGCDRTIAAAANGVWTGGGWVATDQPYSHEEDMLIAFGGRIEMERAGFFGAFVMRPEGSDEQRWVVSALALAHGDAVKATTLLLSAYAEARRILDARQDNVAAVAAVLMKRELTSSDLEGMLGPLPPATVERRIGREGEATTMEAASARHCLAAMMDGHPFAHGWIFHVSPPRLVWLDMDGTLRGLR